jgi:hypothetical protein
MEAMKSAIGNPKSMSRRIRRVSKSAKMRSPSITSSLGSSSLSPNVNDHEALAAYIMDQMAHMSSSQLDFAGSHGGGVRPRLIESYTCYLPNFMWFQPIAADRTVMRPTSLCSGTGITCGGQYLQPEMLKVFSVFGSYLLGSGHLFQDDGEGGANNRRRAAFWVDAIDENDDEDETADGSVDSTSADDGTAGSDGDDDPRRVQKEFIEKVILDLRRTQMSETKIMHDYTISDK